MSKILRELQARKAKAVEAAAALNAKVGAERAMTEAEQSEFDGFKAAIDACNAGIEREQLLAAETIAAPAAAAPRIELGADRREDDPKRGFRTFGEFAQATYAAAANPGRPDERLLIGAAAPTTYGNEGSGADGGYAVPPEFARDIMSLALGEDSYVPLTDNVNVSGNSMVFPATEQSPWGTDGIRAYWQAEATAATATKPVLKNQTLRLHKLMALTPLTEELVADTNALDSLVPRLVGDSIRWKVNEAILWGNGAGQPQGIINSGAVVQVSKENAQSGTVVIANLAKMVSRLMPGSFGRSVWLVNPDVLPSLFQLTLGNYPIYLPISAGAQGSPYGMLMGRPVMVSQHAQTLATVGDVMLLDFSYYRTITKAGGAETATSMHLYFDAAATAFRTIFRIDGQAKLSAPVSPAKGSNTLSPFIKLETR